MTKRELLKNLHNQCLRKRAITTLSNAIIIQIPGFSGISSGDGHGAATASSIAMTSFGILLTDSISAGLILGFIIG
jgi:hypothetical protein